jgi:hypothetical protein
MKFCYVKYTDACVCARLCVCASLYLQVVFQLLIQWAYTHCAVQYTCGL